MILHQQALFSMWTRREASNLNSGHLLQSAATAVLRGAERLIMGVLSEFQPRARDNEHPSVKQRNDRSLLGLKTNQCIPLEMFGNLLVVFLTVVITILNGYICLCEVFDYLHSLPAHHSTPKGHTFYVLIC